MATTKTSRLARPSRLGASSSVGSFAIVPCVTRTTRFDSKQSRPPAGWVEAGRSRWSRSPDEVDEGGKIRPWVLETTGAKLQVQVPRESELEAPNRSRRKAESPSDLPGRLHDRERAPLRDRWHRTSCCARGQVVRFAAPRPFRMARRPCSGTRDTYRRASRSAVLPSRATIHHRRRRCGKRTPRPAVP